MLIKCSNVNDEQKYTCAYAEQKYNRPENISFQQIEAIYNIVHIIVSAIIIKTTNVQKWRVNVKYSSA